MEKRPLKILVIGSANTDMVIRTRAFPMPGETVLGGDFLMNPGGKGANQAVAAARLGADVTFITKIGKDVFGSYTLAALQHEGINIKHVIKSAEHPSGVALITVNDKSENTIVVAPGSNMQLSFDEIDEKLVRAADIILMQLEIPLHTIEHVVQQARELGKKLVLNPAPALGLPAPVLDGLFLITPNQNETTIMTGINPATLPDMKRAGNYLLKRGVQNLVITLGDRGAFLMNEQHTLLIPSPLVSPVDTTAAGDVFNGALVTALAEGETLPEACNFACRAAAISVTRRGAQSSAPYRKEI